MYDLKDFDMGWFLTRYEALLRYHNLRHDMEEKVEMSCLLLLDYMRTPFWAFKHKNDIIDTVKMLLSDFKMARDANSEFNREKERLEQILYDYGLYSLVTNHSLFYGSDWWKNKDIENRLKRLIASHRTCPFCGSEDVSFIKSDDSGFIKCNTCNSRGPATSGDLKKAYFLWDERISDSK